MTTTLFDFLKNFNPEAYEIALQIEDEVTTSPASIKTYATTFLECIVDDMLVKSGNKNKVKPTANFTPKVKKLSMFDVIKYSFETQLINAYKLRNTAHYSLKKTAEEDKRLALELHEKLFHIAWRYFNEFGGNEYNYLGKPKYVPPFRENEEKKLVEVPNIERMEKIFDYCIICGRKNNSHYHNLCNSCNNRIEHVEDIINLKNHFEGKFTKRNIVDLGYSKPYSDALVRELLDEKLILKNDKAYCFNDECFDEYLNEIEMYGEIELVMSEFASGKLTLKDMKESEYYIKGRDSIKPFTQVYKIVSDTIFREFISQLELGIEISDIMEDTTITEEEINTWYAHQINAVKKGFKSRDFINYNKISIDSYLKLRASGKTKDEILSELHLPDDIVDFWTEAPIRELDYFKTSLDDVLMDLILNAIHQNRAKNDILEKYQISSDELERLLKTYDDFRQIYEREYISKRREEFLYYLNENNLDKSIEKANLSRDEVMEWLKDGEKDFELKHHTELCEFYRNTLERFMKLYIRYRSNALSKSEAARKINKTPKTIDQWLRRDDYEIFRNFQIECQNITIKILINGLKKGLSLKQTSALADMNQNALKKLIKKGQDGDERYIELYNVYEDKYIPSCLKTFTEKIKTSKLKKALKASHLTEQELNSYYISGLEGNEKFKEFSDEYFQFKLKNYTKEIINKGKTPSKAARNANFLPEDYEYRKDEIDKVLIENQLRIIIPLIEGGYILKPVADKINVNIETLFDWYIRGYEGDETFKHFSESYWENRIQPGVDDFQSLFNAGISEKFFLKHIIRKNVVPEYKFWKKLGLFEYSNKMLEDGEQLNIIKENVFDVKENVRNLLKAVEENPDMDVPLEELIGDIDDSDLKREIKEFLDKQGEKNE